MNNCGREEGQIKCRKMKIECMREEKKREKERRGKNVENEELNL